MTVSNGCLTFCKKKLPYLLLFVLFAVHAAFLVHYAVDVPAWDEWDFLSSKQLPSGLSLSWLFRAHNEHRIVPTKLLTWVLLSTDGWNNATNQYINFALFGAMLLSFFWLKKRIGASGPSYGLAWFLLFLLSPIAAENHAWAFQSQFHFVLFFFFLSVGFLFEARQKNKDLILGSLFAVSSIYSFSTGPTLGVVLTGAYALFKWDRFNTASAITLKRRELLQGLFVIGIIGSAISAWVFTFHRVLGHPPPESPFGVRFWLVFLNLISFGFGYHVQSWLIGLVCLIAVVSPLYVIWRQRGVQDRTSLYALSAAIFGVLGAVATIAYGRGGFGVLSSKTSRYSEIAFVLIPLTIIAWGVALRFYSQFNRRIYLGLWILCLGGYSNTNNWHFSYYGHYQKMKLDGLSCINLYIRHQGPAVCPTLFPLPLVEHLENAKALKLSFVEKLNP